MKMACLELIGGRGRGHDWRGRGHGRLFEGRGFNRGRGMRSVGRANTSSAIEEVSQVFKVEMSADEWEKWCQFKVLNLGERKSSETSTSANFSGTWDWKNLRTGSMRDGLYYLDNDAYHTVVAALPLTPLEEVLLQHRRLGHLSFVTMSQLYPDLFSKVSKEKLVCDACQYGKQTRSSYSSSDNRSNVPLQIIHSDVWGPSGVVSLNGYRYFLTFIDCCTRTTWVYVLRSKNEVFECFKDFHNLVTTQYNACGKVLRSDNGTEFVNKELDGYLSSHGIIHQTTCPGTYEHNGLAERKNRHLLEISRCLMFSMNVPKNLWCEAVMAAAYLMNRMPTRVLDYKTPIECLTGKTTYVVPPKVFGCTCFVKDYRPSVGKLDPMALNCIFVGYSGKQKGYKCWCPSARRIFVSMDVVFREHEPFYGEATNLTDLTDVFPDLLSTDISSSDCKAVEDKHKDNHEASREVVIGVIPAEDMNTIEIEQVHGEGETQGSVNRDLLWSKPNEEQNPQVYTRRHKTGEKQAQGELQPLGHDSESHVPVDSHDSTSHEGSDDEEIKSIKKTLAKSFEVKDLGYLHYFLGIEVAYGAQGICCY